MHLPLFNINGRFGCEMVRQTDFPRVEDLLAHMDRLGIARSLTYHGLARVSHAVSGNRRLLAEIESTPSAPDRLLPAFVVGPSMLYERRGLEDLTEAVRSGRVRALRLFPVFHQKLEHFFPVLAKVASYQPVLLCDAHDGIALPNLGALAEAFPQCPIVMTHAMWGELPPLLNWMRRYENVHTDTSCLHTTGTIERLCREFGSGRVLFGLGWKSQQGAAIGTLLYADISDSDRARIAHENAERLLGISPTPLQKSDLLARPDKPLWRAFVKRDPLPVPITDSHSHFGPNSAWLVEDQEMKDQIPAALHRMDQMGIATLIASSNLALMGDPVEGNNELVQMLKPYGKRFLGWIVYNPHYAENLDPLLDRWLADPFFVGFKILGGAYWEAPVTDRRYEAVWQRAHRYRLPVLIHTSDNGPAGPGPVGEVAPKYPEAIFLLGHSGLNDAGRRVAEEIVNAHPNVYLESCGSFVSTISWRDTLSRVPPNRLLYGSDGVFHAFEYELGLLLSQDVPDETLQPALGATIRSLLERRVR